MIILYLVFFILLVYSFRCKQSGSYEDYLSLDTTNTIKGIFIILVFISHVIPYISGAGYDFTKSVMDKLFLWIHQCIGQWIVALFLFYSGYGITESIRRKGVEYISAIPRKRFLPVLLNFDVAVLIFVAVNLLLERELTLESCLLSFTGWESVGNSNWYIFCILLLYVITWLSFSIKAKSYTANAIICLLLSGGVILLLSFYKADYWYNTMLCFNAGIFFSLYRKVLEKIVLSHYWFSVALLSCLMIFLHFIPYSFKGLTYNAFAVVFSLLIVLLSMRFKVNNKALIWLGKNLFPLYIYQRIPMIVLATVGSGYWIAEWPLLYVGSCALVTIVIAYFYKYWAIKVN